MKRTKQIIMLDRVALKLEKFAEKANCSIDEDVDYIALCQYITDVEWNDEPSITYEEFYRIAQALLQVINGGC